MITGTVTPKMIRRIRKKLNRRFKKYDFTVESVTNDTTIKINVLRGKREFKDILHGGGYATVNISHVGSYKEDNEVLRKILNIAYGIDIGDEVIFPRYELDYYVWLEIGSPEEGYNAPRS